jgi:NAD(P)-dependent dehydrogenase (short-subunit alcohol dehydrogenase family)
VPDLPRLAGQVAIVTGASSGLGRATARQLARDGAAVSLLARDAGGLTGVQREVASGGGTALALPADLADPAAAEAAVRRTAAEWGRVDILVSAAGTDVPGTIEEISVADWDRVMAVNLRAPFLLSRAAFSHMRAAGGGTIVNVSSVAGLRGWANAAAYCSAKFGLTGFTQALAAEGKPYNIRACVLYPGAMDTSWGTWTANQRDHPGRPPSARPAEEALPPEQVAELIAWIAAAPPAMTMPQVIVTPLLERGWP